MINHAMFVHKDELNKFTTKLRDKIKKDNKPVLCKLRNGDHRLVTHKDGKPEDYEYENFHCPEWNYVWNLDGSSITSSDYDIVEY